jgi:hypothetical protein
MFGGFCCFAVTDLSNQGSGLSTAKIFATIGLISYLREIIFFIGMSLGFYY